MRGLLLAMGACASMASGAPRTITDEMGRQVTLATCPVRRIVSLAPSDTEILFAIGAGDLVVGRDSFSDYPPAALRVSSVGSDYEPSIERIVGLRPDIVLTATTANLLETREALERLSVPVYTTRTEALSDLDRTIADLALLVGRESEARALAASIASSLTRIREAARKLPRVKALIVVWNEPLYVVGPSEYAGEILDLAGGQNVAADAGKGFPKYSLERVLKGGPEALFIGSHKDSNSPDPVRYWSRFTTIPAVKSGRIHTVDGDTLFRPGPRVIEGAKALFALLHPGAQTEGGR